MRLLESPRRRRRLLLTVVPLAIAVPLVYLGVHYSTPGNPDRGRAEGNPTIYRQPKSVPFTPAKQRAVRATLAEFVERAVARHDPGQAWNLAGPSLREGTTVADWRRGDIPVVPYPAAKHGQGTWSYVQFSYPNRVGVEVLLFPKPHSGYSMATADTELQRGRDGRWRVDYWMIQKFHGPAAAAPKVHKPAGTKQQTRARRPAPQDRTAAPAQEPKPLDRKWLLVPAALLSLVILVPLAVGLGTWVRNRRAEAEFKRS